MLGCYQWVHAEQVATKQKETWVADTKFIELRLSDVAGAGSMMFSM